MRGNPSTFRTTSLAAALAVIGLGYTVSMGQGAPTSPLVESGQITVAGRQVNYRIRNLPVSSFPELPQSIADNLNQRGCLIPQSYQAHHPENVIHGSFEHPGSNDWAVLCSAENQVSLLIFLASGVASEPVVLATSIKTDRLQVHDLTGELGFNWGIDPASPKRVHEAQAGMTHRPPSPDHDAVADSVLDRKTVYHLYRNGVWEKLDTE